MQRRRRLIMVLAIVTSAAALWTSTVRLHGEPLASRFVGGVVAGLGAAVIVLIAARMLFRRRG